MQESREDSTLQKDNNPYSLMENKEKINISDYLHKEGVAATPVRILVYKALLNSRYPMSLSDLESELESVDKSTISRTLITFKNHHLLHSINDGSGSVKYEVCHSCHHLHHDDMHVHFRCMECGVTKCLNELSVPSVQLPEGYMPLEINYVVTGICADCTRNL